MLKAYAPAHTDSDISVHLTDANVLCVGDTWWNGVYPFIDYSTGGSIDGMIRAAEATLSRAGADTISSQAMAIRVIDATCPSSRTC